MTHGLAAITNESARTADRRHEERTTSVLRLAVIDVGGGTHLCRVNSISMQGLQATVFGDIERGAKVNVRIADEINLAGSVTWKRGRVVALRLDEPLSDPCLISLSKDVKTTSRRRRAPRIPVSAGACLRSGVRTYAVELLDISPKGAMVQTRQILPALGPVSLDVLGLPRIDAQIRWFDEDRAGLLFNYPLELATLTGWMHTIYSPAASSDQFRPLY